MTKPAPIVLPLLADCGLWSDVGISPALVREARGPHDADDRLDGLTDWPDSGLRTAQAAYPRHSAQTARSTEQGNGRRLVEFWSGAKVEATIIQVEETEQ